MLLASVASRAVLAALLTGLATLPAAAAIPGTTDTASGAAELRQTGSQAGPGREATADPGVGYRWDKPGNIPPAAASLPDERTSPRQNMVRIAQALLLVGVTGLGLSITLTSLFRDRKRRRRVAYRPRGP